MGKVFNKPKSGSTGFIVSPIVIGPDESKEPFLDETVIVVT